MLTTENQDLHFLFEERPRQAKENFVVFCSACTCVLRVSRGLVDTGTVVEALLNECPGCGASLEGSVAERTMSVPQGWAGISLSVSRPKARRDDFRSAGSYRGFRTGIPRLDGLLEPLEQGKLAVFRGWPAGPLAELLCFRAQLPAASGGMDSTAVFADGGNCSDLYMFSRFAAKSGVPPKRAMRRVMTSRAFTVYQLAGMIIRELPRVVEESGAKLVVVSDVLSMFADPSISDVEGRRVASAIGHGLRSLKRPDAFVVVTLGGRTPYDERVCSHADILLEFEREGERVKANLLKHPKRRQATASFSHREAFGTDRNEAHRFGKDRPIL
jgi:hypothetical protein